MKKKLVILLNLALGLLQVARAQTTAFTYQGKLTDGTNAATGLYDMTFSLFDAATVGTGNQVGSTLTGTAMPVTNGLFTTSLDFGSAPFNGASRWLEVSVKTNGGATYTKLSPRTPLTPTPYAIYAQTAGSVPTNAVGTANLQTSSVTSNKIASGQVVKSLNGLTDAVNLVAGANVSLTANGNNLTISSSGSGAFSLNGSSAYYTAGNVGIGTNGPTHRLHLAGLSSGDGIFLEGTSPGYMLQANGGAGFAEASVPGAWSSSATANDAVLRARSGSKLHLQTGYGNSAMTISGANIGIGTTNPQARLDVRSSAPSGTGVAADSGGSNGTGVYASALGSGGRGVVGWGTSTGVLGVGDDYAVYGDCQSYGRGVFGNSWYGTGVYGHGVTGVYGESQSGNGVYGIDLQSGYQYPSVGVLGESKSQNGGVGVSGVATNYGGINGSWSTGVHGAGTAFGVYGEVVNSTYPGETAGVYGHNSAGDGVHGYTAGDGYGLHGNASGTGSGLMASYNDVNRAYLGSQDSAAAFYGNVAVYGNFQVSGSKNFVIDHPLDPANKYLNHSCVESSERKNIYDGVAVLDANGQAVVELPNWFEALNKDFRYQLTAIGAPGPNLHIAEEISKNRFTIAGGSAGMKASWQVTGIRKDAWAETHPLQVEEAKPASERGTYLAPEEHGQTDEKSVCWARHAKPKTPHVPGEQRERPSQSSP